MTSGKQADRSFGAAVAVALLALAPSVQASIGQSPCVRIATAARSSSCVPGANIESFAFSMEGTTGAAAYDALETEDDAPRADVATRLSKAEGAGESIVPCRATDVTITVGFAAPVISVNYQGGATVSGSSMVTFFAETLESNPTEFAVVLDTTGVATDSKVVTYVSYSDNEGSFPDMSGLMTVASVAPECDPYTAAEARRKLQTGGEYDECDVCSNLSSAQLEALDMYDNGGKKIVCDPTCLDGVSDPTHCNYFGLGQICRGCGECSTCAACPDTDETPAPTPSLTRAAIRVPTPAGTPSPTPVPAVDSTRLPLTRAAKNDDNDDDDDASKFDCSPCTELSDDQLEALTRYDRGGKRIVCDPTCLDGFSDSTHCNYFGLGQICRGCGTCPTCTACP